MIVPLAEYLESHTIDRSLNVAEGLSECVGAEVAFQVDGSGPSLHELANGLRLQRFGSLSAFEKILIVGWLDRIEIVPQRSVDRLVDHKDVVLAGLAFLDGDELTGLQVSNLLHFEPDQIHDPQAVVDPHGEKQMISRILGEEL